MRYQIHVYNYFPIGLPAEVKRLIDKLVISVDGDTWTFNNIVGENQNKVTLKVGQMVEYSMPPTTMKVGTSTIGYSSNDEYSKAILRVSYV